MTTLKSFSAMMLICTLLIAACSNEPAPGATTVPPPSAMRFSTSVVRERMTLPPSWTPTATPSITPTATVTSTPTITPIPSATPTRTVAEMCALFEGQLMTYGRTRFDIRWRIEYFFVYDDLSTQIVIKAQKQDSDEIAEVSLPPGFVLGTFDLSTLSAGRWDISYSLNTPQAQGVCESDPIMLEIFEPSPLDRLVDALSTLSAAQNPTATATPGITPEATSTDD